MKIVINSCFGGLSLSESCAQALGCDTYPDDNIRTDARLIEMVEADAEFASGHCAKLQVVEIPDSATDYYINEYDGAEDIIYVVNGKLHWA